MVTIDLESAAFRDKVYGCWMGKNCGGTLGAPLEEVWGKQELFDVWWYPQLQEGGIPNDDLEMQLIWLKALEEVGPHITAIDLAQYWLDHIGYNWDEYGLSKTNLHLGLLPPISGAYNNWFKDCMGSPIRSEIWACVAPGVPSIAARLAYADAICDHASGEGVFGSLFNAAVESAAFVVSDREQLIEIGLSYIPSWSKTAKAIEAARTAYVENKSWQEAREYVLQVTPSPIAQYAPINLGFQIIGWLYGEDFGDALCKAVNCGYDTDCTGATLGSYLGILAGRHALPEKWTAPLGDSIATNESWGGIRHASDGSNPVPTNLTALTDRVCAMAKRVLSAYDLLQKGTLLDVDVEHLMAGPEIRALWRMSPFSVSYRHGTIGVGIDYGETPTCQPETQRMLQTTLINTHEDEIRVDTCLHMPFNWQDKPQSSQVVLAAHTRQTLTWSINIPPARFIESSNTLLFSVQAQGYPAQPAIPVVLVGTRKYRFAGPFAAEGRSDRELFDTVFAPEMLTGSPTAKDGRDGNWREGFACENALPLGEVFSDGGVLYVQTFLWAPVARSVWMGAATTSPVKYWVNGIECASAYGYRSMRPNYGIQAEDGFASVALQEGWNEMLLKFVHSPREQHPCEAHFLLSSDDVLHNGLSEIRFTRFPWDE
jgi:ADP-ribosylglycohydrolase